MTKDTKQQVKEPTVTDERLDFQFIDSKTTKNQTDTRLKAEESITQQVSDLETQMRRLDMADTSAGIGTLD